MWYCAGHGKVICQAYFFQSSIGIWHLFPQLGWCQVPKRLSDSFFPLFFALFYGWSESSRFISFFSSLFSFISALCSNVSLFLHFRSCLPLSFSHFLFLETPGNSSVIQPFILPPFLFVYAASIVSISSTLNPFFS